MSLKNAALLIAMGALLVTLPSCYISGQTSFPADSEGAIPGIQVGDEPSDVIAVLGPPKDRASGWWEGGSKFVPDYEVWYYKGTGRVVFAARPQKMVFTTEADPEENGRSWGPR